MTQKVISNEEAVIGAITVLAKHANIYPNDEVKPRDREYIIKCLAEGKYLPLGIEGRSVTITIKVEPEEEK